MDRAALGGRPDRDWRSVGANARPREEVSDEHRFHQETTTRLPGMRLPLQGLPTRPALRPAGPEGQADRMLRLLAQPADSPAQRLPVATHSHPDEGPRLTTSGSFRDSPTYGAEPPPRLSGPVPAGPQSILHLPGVEQRQRRHGLDDGNHARHDTGIMPAVSLDGPVLHLLVQSPLRFGDR